ncbi:MAG TPA: fibronectin type III domain-containing protein, partial [Candidatus Sumerlaeota bacterium]|nr:fibronectin type III domain-containing protein [Candidatus Sumerlaeota bacterium]
LNHEMCGTIIEVAFHDVAADAEIMRDPRARDYSGRASYHAIVKFLNSKSGGAIPLALLPDPPTHVRAMNNADGTITVSWMTPTVDGVGGDAATGYVVYRSENGFAFGQPVEVAGGGTISLVVTGLAPGKEYYFQVSATNAGGESMPTETVGARAGYSPSRVLIVNGFDRFDSSLSPMTTVAANIGSYGGGGGTFGLLRPFRMNSFSYVFQHGRAVKQADRYFDSCGNEAVKESLVTLSDYDTVVWICGEESTADSTFDIAEQAMVQTFLSAGGTLFASGGEIGWDLDQANKGRDFYRNILKTTYEGNDAETFQAAGVNWTLFHGIPTFDFSEAAGAPYNADFPDQISPLDPARACFSYAGGKGGTAGIMADTGIYKVIVLGFPFECITDSDVRGEIMKRALDFFGVPIPLNPSVWILY